MNLSSEQFKQSIYQTVLNSLANFNILKYEIIKTSV